MGHKILLADDSATIRKVVELAFMGEANYELIVTASGDEAIATAGQVQPDLVLADHNMPGRDGYDVAGALQGTRVLLLTGSSKAFDVQRAASVGVQDHLEKPFDCHSLLSKVAALVGAQAPQAAPQLRPAGHFGTPPPSAGAPAPAQPPRAAQPPAAPSGAPVAGRPAQTLQFAVAPPAIGNSVGAGAGGGMQMHATSAPAVSSPPSSAQPATPTPAASSMAAASQNVAARAGAEIASSTSAGSPSAEAITAEARSIIERVVWEVVPELAETLIREEIARLIK